MLLAGASSTLACSADSHGLQAVLDGQVKLKFEFTSARLRPYADLSSLTLTTAFRRSHH
jgi:hypothetical protein